MLKFLKFDETAMIVRSTITPFRFPGGEWHLKNIDENEKSAGAVLTGASVNSDELVLLGLWADAMKQIRQKTVVYMPYAPAARADRGNPFGAKVYAEIINSFKLDEVIIFDPHSPVIVELLDNVRVVDSAPLIKNFIAGENNSGGNVGFSGVIAPDAGAVPRATAAAELLELPVFTATKERDFETGKLTNFKIEGLPENGKLLVVDDICDGGATFAGLAKASGLPPERLALWVSHGIFSGYAVENLKAFGAVYTTDSHPGARDSEVPALIAAIEPWLLFN